MLISSVYGAEFHLSMQLLLSKITLVVECIGLGIHTLVLNSLIS